MCTARAQVDVLRPSAEQPFIGGECHPVYLARGTSRRGVTDGAVPTAPAGTEDVEERHDLTDFDGPTGYVTHGIAASGRRPQGGNLTNADMPGDDRIGDAGQLTLP